MIAVFKKFKFSDYSNSILRIFIFYTKQQNYTSFKKTNYFQLDNADEQAATIRRELDSRMKQTENVQKVS